ncbi:PrsW family intramembrane metalloprotease [bacterium]|nr:PrsW family intramembrane metalloprotease [bacterium]
MDFKTIFALSFGPGIFWMIYLYKKDKLEPEPKSLVIKIFFLGLLAAIPIAIVETFFTVSKFWLLVLVAPVIEEYGKYLVVKKFAYTNDEFNEPMDGIIYASAAALGFASIENLGYIYGTYSTTNIISSTGTAATAAITIAVLRALLSVPGHAIWSSMWGYALGKAKFLPEAEGKKLVAQGLFLAMVLHGVFNFMTTLGGISVIALFVGIFYMWKMLNKRIDEAEKISPHQNLPPQNSPNQDSEHFNSDSIDPDLNDQYDSF